MAKVLKMLSTLYGGFRGRLTCSCGSGNGAAGEGGWPVAAGHGSDDEEPMPAIRAKAAGSSERWRNGEKALGLRQRLCFSALCRAAGGSGW
jgi:hypothetical protein